mmetsp:Transcript_16339/g.38411  ORF Transcript_16339/g.38411 Transcript_16339/m.38411 type:complete len:206 (-) Transcript_16339:231-848(-)
MKPWKRERTKENRWKVRAPGRAVADPTAPLMTRLKMRPCSTLRHARVMLQAREILQAWMKRRMNPSMEAMMMLRRIDLSSQSTGSQCWRRHLKQRRRRRQRKHLPQEKHRKPPRQRTQKQLLQPVSQRQHPLKRRTLTQKPNQRQTPPQRTQMPLGKRKPPLQQRSSLRQPPLQHCRLPKHPRLQQRKWRQRLPPTRKRQKQKQR